jgi:hypothetical protein
VATTVKIGGSGALFVGEDKIFRLSLPGVNMAGWDVIFDVRKTDAARDPAIFSKTASITGIYDPIAANNTQLAVVALSDTEMNTVKARTYRYSWKRKDDGVETVLARGDFAPEKATAP